MSMLHIMTFNIMFGKHVDRVIDWVNRLPTQDILCFQEFPKDKINESIRVLGRTPYGYRYAPFVRRRKRVYGELTLYRKNILSHVSSRIIQLGGSRLEKSVLRSPVSRSCLVNTFQYKGKKVIVANVHLTFAAANRFKYHQVETVLKSIYRSNYPSILVGDFNISNLIGKRFLYSILKQYGFTGDSKKLTTYHLSFIRHQLDYIFVKNCKLTQIRSERIRLSDHYPVFAHCRID